MFMDDFDDIIDNSRKNSNPQPKKVVYKTFDSDELVHMVRKSRVEGYDDFTKELYPHSLHFYDFEVFMGDWMVVIINPVRKSMVVIVNDEATLSAYYEKYKDEIWVGYNSRTYDTFILKSILLGLNPKIVNDEIIVNRARGWSLSKDFQDIQLYNFDIMPSKQIGLKQLEAFMGNDICETSVPFDIERPLTKKEVMETIKYCIHDVEQTIEVFRRRKSEFDAHMDLINTFRLPLSMINLTQPQLTANIIGCNKVERDNDEFDLKFVKTLRLKKYKMVKDWFESPKNHTYDKKNRLVMNVCGIPHTFGWGGIHGCPDKPLYRKGRIFHVDVTSYYPSIMIEYDFLTRNCSNKNKFKQIYDKRVELKKAGKKKEQAPYKIILNGTYGICKDEYSKAYDPRQANNVCVNGQLMLLDLLEHLEGYADIIQSNTDGIILQVEDNDEAVAKMKEICQEWMDRTHMGLGFDEIEWIVQKDVNGYIFKFTNGKYERKGAYVKELDELDNDLPIVNEALVNYFTNNLLPEGTINGCDELIKFQKVVKISSNYKMGWHNGEYLKDKTFRVFASNDMKDTYMGKVKYEGATIEKFGDTPDRCFIDNGYIKGKKIPSNLDRKWYINLAYKRLGDYGISLKDDDCLF